MKEHDFVPTEQSFSSRSLAELTTNSNQPRLRGEDIFIMPEIGAVELEDVQPQVSSQPQPESGYALEPQRRLTPDKQQHVNSYWENLVASGKISQERAEQGKKYGILPIAGGERLPREVADAINPDVFHNDRLQAIARDIKTFAAENLLDSEALNEFIADARRLRFHPDVDEEEARQLLVDLQRVRSLAQVEGRERRQRPEREEDVEADPRAPRIDLGGSENRAGKQLRDAINGLQTIEDIRQAMEGPLGTSLRDFLRDTNVPEAVIDARLSQAVSSPSPEAVKRALNRLLGEGIRKIRAEREGVYRVPGSIQELCEMIMEKSAPEWRDPDRFPLLDAEGNVNKENFLRWIRSQARYWDAFSPDERINLFSDIKAQTPLRQIAFQEMISIDSYFIDQKDEKQRVMEDFRNQVLHEVWLFDTARNWDVEVRKAMGVEDQLSKTLQSLFYSNTFTKMSEGKTTFEWILTMPKKFLSEQEKQDGKEQDQLIGKGVRRAVLTYKYLSDIEMLRKTLGDDAALFQKDFNKYDADMKTVKGPQSGATGAGWKDTWYDADGKLRFDDKDVVREFTDYIDIFKDIKKDPRIVSEVRDRLAESLKQISTRDTEVQDRRVEAMDFDEAKYAEAWAFKMANWMGITAKSSANAWRKIQETKRYREGQKRGSNLGFYGNPENVDSFQQLGVNMLDGITDTNGRTILEIIQGGEGSEVNLDKPIGSADEPLVFSQNAMQKYADDHVTRTFSIFQHVIENNELNLDNFTYYDPIRGIVFDPDKAKNVIDGIFKQVRYAYGTWDQLDFTKLVRVEDGKGGYEDITIAERMFGGNILDEWKDEQGNIKRDKLIESLSQKENREVFFQRVIEELIGTELRSHIKPDSPYRKYGYAEVERIIDWVGQHYLGEEGAKRVRKVADFPFWMRFLREMGIQIVAGAAVGTKEAVESTAEQVVK